MYIHNTNCTAINKQFGIPGSQSRLGWAGFQKLLRLRYQGDPRQSKIEYACNSVMYGICVCIKRLIR